MRLTNNSAGFTCLLLLLCTVLAVNSIDDDQDSRYMLRKRGVAKPEGRLEETRKLQTFGMERSESVDGHGDEFELDGSLDRPGGEIDPPGPGDQFEMDAKMPKRSFEHSESISRDDGPNRLDPTFTIVPEPTDPPLMPATLAPTTLTPTTLSPTTMNPTTLAPSRMTSAPTMQPTEPKRATTLPPYSTAPTTMEPTTIAPTTVAPTTLPPTQVATPSPTDQPTTQAPVSFAPTTNAPTTFLPTTMVPTTLVPTTLGPSGQPTFPPTLPPSSIMPTMPPTLQPTSQMPTLLPTTFRPTLMPITQRPTPLPTTFRPTPMPVTARPTIMPVTLRPTLAPSTEQPSTHPTLTRVAQFVLPTSQTCEHDYIIPEGAHGHLIPCELINELILTLRRGGQLIEPLFGPYNSTFKMEEFLNALNTSYDWDVNIADNSVMDRNGNRKRNLVQMQEMMSNVAPTPSPNAVQMNLGGEKNGPGAKGRVDVAMAHMGILLGQAYQESMITGMCDEQNTKPTDKVNPGCGQDGLNYRFPNVDGQLGEENHFSCFANEQEWMTGYRPIPDEQDPRKNTEFVGCPLQPPVDMIVSDTMPSNRPKNEYEEMPLMCGLDADIGSRSCCWWGRGMLQMTYQCDYGDFQQNWGSYYQVPDREDINLCANPGQVCSDVFPEMKYLTGLFTWVKKVVHNPRFDFMRELTEWVDNGRDYNPGGFVDRIGGVLVYGDPTKLPPNAQERRNYMKAAVEAIMSLPPWGVEQYFHYGNVAQCKPAVQSSIFNSTSDSAAHSALVGHRNASKMADTNCDHNPFWKVDLGSSYQILSVHVVWYEQYHHEMMDIPEFNVTGGDTITKTNRELQIDLLDDSGNNVASLNRTQFKHSIEADGKIEDVWTVHVENSTDLIASQVRVSIVSRENECDFLSLAEVLVMSVCELGDACLTKSTCAEQNVAQCKPTVQSSTINSGTADLAVDGANAEVATTECEEAPYFMVDLMDLYNITSVALINHADGDGLKRLNGVVVELLDVNDNVVAEDSHEPNLLGDEMGDVYIMKFVDTPAIACKVRVSLQHPPGSCESLKLSEVAVMATCLDDGEHCKTWENCRHQNVARCMPATQSSIFDGGIAARAVDGHTSLAHTKCEEEPWWGIHLLGSHPVKEVVIHNREDCCFERLNNVQVALLDDAGNTLASVSHDTATMGVIEQSWTAVFANTDAESISASKVRVITTHAPGTCEPLNLAEVQVMSPCAANDATCLTWADCDNGNVAQCKPAEQSSTIYGDIAANAVNGHESLAHTDCETSPWWEVDLLSPRSVNGVVIHNREDCCWERLNGILIELLDATGAVTGSIQHDPIANGEIKTMWVTTFADVTASRVRLSVQHAEGTCDFLNLAEVEVRSTCVEGDACLTGFGCDHGNVAKCKPARQSSTLPASNFMTIYQGVAGDAVDGTESLAHTDCEQEPWWEVNLLYRREVSEVVLHNREDCCFERLNGAIVDLLDKEHNVISRVQHSPETEGEINTMWVARFPPMSMAWYVRVMVEHAAGTCDFLNLAEVEVISACEEGDACMNPETECVQGNVAQCKPARQISTVDGAVARNAVDSERSISRTDCEERPWWEVDLQGVYHVSEVVLFNRIDCCQEELSNVMVELVNSTGHTVKMVQHDPITDGIINATWAAKFDDFGDFANKVRVSLLNDVGECKNLHLADIQVMSTCLETDACYFGYSCGDGNVAQCKPASQSSTREGMVADKALDGEESLSMTECENSPWWIVDLQTDYNVKEVAVYNRRDCCFERLNGTLVELLDVDGGVVASVQHNPERMGMIQDVWVAHFDPANSPPARSVRVSVRHEGDTCDYLELAEVQVLSACKENDACMTGFDCENSYMQAT